MGAATGAATAGFARDGFVVLPRLLTDQACDALVDHVAGLGELAGSRSLLGCGWCASLARQLREHPALAAYLPPGHRAIQCTLFDKSPQRNWLVALHQDLSVPAVSRIDAPGWSGWSVKQGQLFGQAPRAVLEELVALRLHLDACSRDDGALRVVARSHLGGVRSPEAARRERDAGAETVCMVERGGVMLMRPLLLHASSKSTSGRRRRVLHFVFAPHEREPGLCWPWPQGAPSIRC